MLLLFTPHPTLFLAQVSRKLTFLYLANDVIQNSKRKGPEFTQDFAPVIVDAFKHVSRWALRIYSCLLFFCRNKFCFNIFFHVTDPIYSHIMCSEGEEGCKKHLDRVLSIWQERAVYENDLLDKLSVVLRKYILNSRRFESAIVLIWFVASLCHGNYTKTTRSLIGNMLCLESRFCFSYRIIYWVTEMSHFTSPSIF